MSLPADSSDGLGVDGKILELYPSTDPRRIALLRVHHACENTQMSLYACGNALANFLDDPPGYLLDEMLAEQMQRLASRLSVLSAELLKSLPELSKKGTERAERTDSGLRGDHQAPNGEVEGPAGDRPDPDDWGDVPF